MLDKHNTGIVKPPPCRTQNSTKYDFAKVAQQGEKTLIAGTTKYHHHHTAAAAGLPCPVSTLNGPD